MAVIWTWRALASAGGHVVISGGYSYEFAAGTFNSAITVGSYNTSMHVEDSGNGEFSSGSTLNTSEWVSDSSGAGSKGELKVNGGATVLLDDATVTSGNAPLQIIFDPNLGGQTVATSLAKFYAYGNGGTGTAPDNITFKAYEQGDTGYVWQTAGGDSKLSLADNSAAATHGFYLYVSASPDTVGVKEGSATTDEFHIGVELTYT